MTGPAYALTPGDLARAQQFVDDSAARMRTQFTKLADTVAAQTNRGAAAAETLRVSQDIQAQAKAFDTIVSQFAAQIGAAMRKYLAGAEAGVQTMRGVTGESAAPVSATERRLAG